MGRENKIFWATTMFLGAIFWGTEIDPSTFAWTMVAAVVTVVVLGNVLIWKRILYVEDTVYVQLVFTATLGITVGTSIDAINQFDVSLVAKVILVAMAWWFILMLSCAASAFREEDKIPSMGHLALYSIVAVGMYVCPENLWTTMNILLLTLTVLVGATAIDLRSQNN